MGYDVGQDSEQTEIPLRPLSPKAKLRTCLFGGLAGRCLKPSRPHLL